jgi:hypothetical protein
MSRPFLKTALWILCLMGLVGSPATQNAAAARPSSQIPLLAFLSAEAPNKITGDGAFYVHQGTTPGLNCIRLESDGSFVMTVYAASQRRVDLKFDDLFAPPRNTNPIECAAASFLASPEAPVPATFWSLRTYWKCRYIPHTGPDGTTWTELIRSTTRKDAKILDLRAMSLGETVGVSVEMMSFRVGNTGDPYGLTGQPLESAPGSAAYLLVTATDWDGDGAMDWVLRTIPGRLEVKEWDRTAVLPEGEAFRLTCGYPCEYGAFALPFELKIAKH